MCTWYRVFLISEQVDHPRRRISKHCRYGEDLQCGGFVHHRDFDLRGAEVLLMPRNLPRRWLWSRKYPICVRLAHGLTTTARTSKSSLSTPSSQAGSCHGTPVRYSSLNNITESCHETHATSSQYFNGCIVNQSCVKIILFNIFWISIRLTIFFIHLLRPWRWSRKEVCWRRHCYWCRPGHFWADHTRHVYWTVAVFLCTIWSWERWLVN